MTRTYAATRLLELGPLTFPEFWRITGWPIHEARQVLDAMHQSRIVALVYENNTNPRYWLHAT